jgi:hypothetical protein
MLNRRNVRLTYGDRDRPARELDRLPPHSAALRAVG